MAFETLLTMFQYISGFRELRYVNNYIVLYFEQKKALFL